MAALAALVQSANGFGPAPAFQGLVARHHGLAPASDEGACTSTVIRYPFRSIPCN